MINTNQLITEIESAFKNTLYPKGSKLSRGYSTEAERVDVLFYEKGWKEITDNFLKQNTYTELAFMSEEAFCYFLPAYMIYVLRYYKHDEDVESADHLLQRTTYKLDNQSLVEKFSPSQIATIVQFIVFAGKSQLFCYQEGEPDSDIARMLQMWGSD